MKNLKALFAVGLFVVGLSFTSCSSDDRYVKPETPEHLPTNPDQLPIPDAEPYK